MKKKSIRKRKIKKTANNRNKRDKLIKNKPKSKKQKPNFLILSILTRYLILLSLMFTLPLIYKILTPLTIYSTGFLLSLFYDVALSNTLILINSKTLIQIIPACVAGSAYLLLLILNLSIPLNFKKRILSIFLSFLILFVLNILRIFFLSILLYNNSVFFDFSHKFFWYFLSTVFIVFIWFFIVKLFSIKEIPVYSDIKFIYKEIKNKQNFIQK